MNLHKKNFPQENNVNMYNFYLMIVYVMQILRGTPESEEDCEVGERIKAYISWLKFDLM